MSEIGLERGFVADVLQGVEGRELDVVLGRVVIGLDDGLVFRLARSGQGLSDPDHVGLGVVGPLAAGVLVDELLIALENGFLGLAGLLHGVAGPEAGVVDPSAVRELAHDLVHGRFRGRPLLLEDERVSLLVSHGGLFLAGGVFRRDERRAGEPGREGEEEDGREHAVFLVVHGCSPYVFFFLGVPEGAGEAAARASRPRRSRSILRKIPL